MKTGRLLISPPLTGAVNMALDQALLELYRPGDPPILRIYQWLRPTLSLGYFQKPEEVADLDFCRANGVDVAKRPTGGGAILHHQELTLALIISKDDPVLKGPLTDSYLKLSEPIL